MPPFAVSHIDHIVLRVSDIDRSVDFYGRVLGCEVVLRRDELGLVHLRAGTALIDLVSLDGRLGAAGGAGPGPQGRNLDHLCLRIDPFDAEAIARHLQSQDVPPLGDIQLNFGAEGYGPSLYIRDPDGNVIEFKGPSRPAAAAR